jgi:hypothetical protein
MSASCDSTEAPDQSVRSSFQLAKPEPIRASAASLRNMSGERKYRASTFNAARRISKASAARRSRRCRRNDVCWLLGTREGSPDVVLYPDVAPCMDGRFDCRDLLQRSVIHYEAASSAIICTIRAVMTGTVAGVSRSPSEDRSSGLVSTQAGAFILAPQLPASSVPSTGSTRREKRARPGSRRSPIAQAASGNLGGAPSSVSDPPFEIIICGRIYSAPLLDPSFDLGLVVQNHVQQGIMDFQFSVVVDKAQFAEFVHEKAYA